MKNDKYVYKIFQEDEDNKERFKIMYYVIMIITAFSMVFLPVSVSGSSMEDTFKNRQPLLVFKLFLRYEYKDILVVYAGDNIPGEKYIIKRVCALPGDLVEIKNGKFYRNQIHITEPYIKESMSKNQIMPSHYIKNNEVFLMGDNRNQSMDSREYGAFQKNDVAGKVILSG
ncbi:signal peptidase I [Proteocatella sphenisci]|uniref:signal peptidase I n=1 Tax=Proteocatella sphenisci TaxID=181070 RepID=UPI0004AC9E68|nr:signal peptidase I [Proteocatella sphenisci]